MIATYAALAMKEGNPVTMISPDKDMMQLVSDDARVRQFLHTKGQFVEEAEVKQKFGVLPPLVPHVQVKSIYLRDSNRGDDDQWIAGSVA
jgi:DNA polymerase-1